MKERARGPIYTYFESLLPKDPEYNSRSIIPLRILHDASSGTIVSILCGNVTDSVLVRIGAGAAIAFIFEFYIQPHVWDIVLKTRK